MKKELLKSSWNLLKGALKEKYHMLTDQDLHYVEGKEDEFYQRLIQRLGKTRAEVDQELMHLHSMLMEKQPKQKMKHS